MEIYNVNYTQRSTVTVVIASLWTHLPRDSVRRLTCRLLVPGVYRRGARRDPSQELVSMVVHVGEMSVPGDIDLQRKDSE